VFHPVEVKLPLSDQIARERGLRDPDWRDLCVELGVAMVNGDQLTDGSFPRKGRFSVAATGGV
jgi:hypothetical protein